MSLYYCLVLKMANAVVLWVIVYVCVTSVNTKVLARRRYFVAVRKKLRTSIMALSTVLVSASSRLGISNI